MKEKKPTLSEALTQTLQAMHTAGCLNLVDIVEGRFHILLSNSCIIFTLSNFFSTHILSLLFDCDYYLNVLFMSCQYMKLSKFLIFALLLLGVVVVNVS